MITEETVNKYSSMVTTVAASYARTYPMVNREDIKQELWIWFLTHQRKLKQWETENEEKDTTKLVARSLRNAAYDYCIKEKAKHSGYETSDNFWYRKDFIKTLLPAALSEDYRKIVQALSENVSSGKSPSEGGDWMAYYSDIRKAYQSLSEEDQKLVYNFYAIDLDGQSLHEIVQDDRPTARATMMAANRALNKMVKLLGGFKPFHDPEIDEKEQEENDDLSELS